MKSDGMLLGEKITKRYPRRGSVQLVRLGSAAQFTCSRCRGTKTARLVAVDGETLYCNGCYRRLGTEPITVRQALPQAPGERRAAPPPPAPTATRAWNPARTVVRQRDWGLPFGVSDSGRVVEWSVTVRAEHLSRGTCPVPVEAAPRILGKPLNVAFLQRGRRSGAFDYQSGALLRQSGDRPVLTGVRWHSSILPGTRVRIRWTEQTGSRLTVTCTALRKAVVVAGTVCLYEYDPRVMTRDLAAADIQADRSEELVLITLRELGYLDEQGRALLPRPALVRNVGEHAGQRPVPVQETEAAIERLLSRALLTWEKGSVGRNGELTYPARFGESLVDLLCYAPRVRDVKEQDIRVVEGQGARAADAHRVAGHLMRIGHLGKEASPEAAAAYVHDRKRAGLAGPHRLPRGYTYVREHERGG
jgi:hypothetical protein